MLRIRLICVGRLKEKFYGDAAAEYLKRLSVYSAIETEELSEARLSERPSQAELDAALKSEASEILGRLPKNAAVVALCVEGTETDSPGLAEFLRKQTVSGDKALCFVIGGSNGLHDSIKARAELRLSMSRMTFPHHLARVMLLEQLYRGFKILEGGKYHK